MPFPPTITPGESKSTTNQFVIARKWFISGVIALCILAFGTTFYSEIEGQWYNSYVKDIVGASLFEVALMVALSSVLGTIFYLVWGVVADNIRPKIGHRVFIILIGSLSTAGLMLLFIASSVYIWCLVIGGICIAITSNMFHVNNRALIADLVPEQRRGRANTLLIVMGMLGSIGVWIATAVLLPGGVVTFTREIHAAFIATGSLVIAITGISIVFLVREPPITEAPQKWYRDLKNIFDAKEMAKHKDFLKLFGAKMFLVAAQYAFYPFLLVLLQRIDIEVEEVLIALPFVAGAVGIGIFLLGKFTDTIGRKKVAITCLACSPVGAMIIAFLGGNLLLMLIGFAVMMPFYTGIGIATDSWVLDLLPKESRGRFVGILNIGAALGKIPGVLIAGWFGESNILLIFLVSGIILWLGIPFYMLVPEKYIPKKGQR
jgi:MFS family permease